MPKFASNGFSAETIDKINSSTWLTVFDRVQIDDSGISAYPIGLADIDGSILSTIAFLADEMIDVKDIDEPCFAIHVPFFAAFNEIVMQEARLEKGQMGRNKYYEENKADEMLLATDETEVSALLLVLSMHSTQDVLMTMTYLHFTEELPRRMTNSFNRACEILIETTGSSPVIDYKESWPDIPKLFNLQSIT